MKKMISMIMAFTLCFILYTPAFAAEKSAEVHTIENVSLDTGHEMEELTINTISDTEYVIRVKDSMNRIVESSSYNPSTDEIIQVRYDATTGNVIDSTTFTASDHYTIISEAEMVPSALNSSVVEETETGNSVSSPQATDYGLPNSGIFSGYKLIGQITDFGATAKLHRHIDSHVRYGESYKFDFAENMTVSTIVSIIQAAIRGKVDFVSLTTAMITGMAKGFLKSIGEGILEGKLQVDRFHYTYKVTVNNSRTATASYCHYKDYFVSKSLDNNNNVTRVLYQGKGEVSEHGVTGHSITKVQMAIQTYLNGDDPWNTVCSLGDN